MMFGFELLPQSSAQQLSFPASVTMSIALLDIGLPVHLTDRLSSSHHLLPS